MAWLTWKAGALVLAAALLIGGGVAGGAWLSSERYAPQLKDQGDKLTACTVGRDNLEELAKAQGAKLGELANQVEQRQARAALDVAKADQAARADYSSAQRLQQERIAGDQCAAAAAVIDKELGV